MSGERTVDRHRPGALLWRSGAVLLSIMAAVLVTVSIVVIRARLGMYLHAFSDLLDWRLVPGLTALAAGVAAGATGARRARAFLVLGISFLAIGAALGVVAGLAREADREIVWSLAVVGGTAGLVLGGGIGAARGGLPLPRWSTRFAAATFVVLVVLGVVSGRGGADPPQPGTGASLPVAEPDSVDSVVFLIGDTGRSVDLHFPVLWKLAADIEWWSARVPSQAGVAVVFLGDVVYPDGLPPRGDAGWPRDSAHVEAQIDVLAGPHAKQRARALFVAGNHDWGRELEREGLARLDNLANYFEQARARGFEVRLVPEPGAPRAGTIDLGRFTRLVLFDSAWWLLAAEPAGKARLLESIEHALASAGDRRVIIGAHHPFESGGRHGGLVPVWKLLGVPLLLARTGSLLQDMNSLPYLELRHRLLEIFGRTRPPALFAGGHDHSLQVIEPPDSRAPRLSVVSGSASKLGEVGDTEGLRFWAVEPGYVRVVTKRDGSSTLRVISAPRRFVDCPTDEHPQLVPCMRAGAAAFRSVYSTKTELDDTDD